MTSLYAFGLPGDKFCVNGIDSGAFDYGNVDLAFTDRHWHGWYTRMPAALAVQAIEHLSHRVSRTPHDLKTHLHRIIASYHSSQLESLYGALLDLFIILDKKGFLLRQRLFNKFAASLPNYQSTALKQALMLGAAKLESLPHSDCSRFNKGVVGNTNLVIKTGEPPQHQFSILDEARDLIDSGLIDDARLILEQAIIQQPDDEHVSRELLDIYRYTKNTNAFAAIYAQLNGQTLALAGEWVALASILLEEEGVVG